MLFIRFSLICLFLVFNTRASTQIFSSKDCVDANFNFKIVHPGKLFGLLKNSLSVSKKECEIEISFKKIIKKSWRIDTCREPVHIKIKDKGSVNVVKRGKGCDDGNYKEDYCQELEEILEIIQDDGLIFAEGKREKIGDQHGQAYCTFLLLKKYLNNGVIFSSFDNKIDIFKGATVAKPSENCDLAQKVKQKGNLSSMSSIENKKNPVSSTKEEDEDEDSF